MNALFDTALSHGKKRWMVIRLLSLCSVLVFGTGSVAHAQLAVSSALTPEQLVTQIFAGANAVITNVSYNGAPGAIGSFTANASNLGLHAGIIMTTGSIGNAVGPNIDSNRTTENGTPGDIDLRKLHSSDTVVVRDAAVLEFDFYSYADRITFEYVFASEEYPEFRNSIYNDGFGFFISGPGYIGNENIALLPGSALPVSIGNINQDVNAHLYIDNTNGQTLEYDGFTTVLTAEATVVPCATYHLKLAIGDVSDELYDSGVFLKAGSFETGSSVYIGGKKNAIEGCGVGNFMLVRLGRSNHSITYNYLISGSATSGVDFVSLPGKVGFAAEQDTAYVRIEALDDMVFDPGETVTITLKNNCGFVVDTATITIGEAQNFSVQIDGDYEACLGTPVQLRSALGGGTGPYIYLWEPPMLEGSSIIHRPDSSMYYYVSVRDSSNGCVARDSFFVRVYSLELDEADDIHLCPGQEDRIGNEAKGGKPPFKYQWDPPIGLSSYTEAQPTAFPDITTEYVVRVKDALGCETTDTILVHVSDLSVEAPPKDTLCALGIKQLAAVASGGGGEYKYRWEPAIGVSDTTRAEPYFSPPYTTKYKVFVTDKIGCVAVDSFTLRVNPELIVNAGPDMHICPGLPAQIGTVTHGGSPPYTFEWQPPFDLEDPTAERPTIIPATTRTYRVRVTDAFGCESEDVITVYVEPTVIAEAGRDTTICRGASKLLQGSVRGGVPPYLYKWHAASVIDDSLSIQPIVEPDTTTTYYLTITDSVGCTYVDSVTVTVTDLPLVDITAAGSVDVCEKDSVYLIAESGFSRYLWSNGDTTEIAKVYTTGNYGVTAWTAEGCEAHSDSIHVTVHELPDIEIFGPASVCLESQSLYYIKPAPLGFEYTWTVTGGTMKDRINNSITVEWDGTPLSMITVVVKDPVSGCTETIEYPVTVSTTLLPVVSYAGDSVRCAGDSVRLNAGLGYATYRWSTGDSTESIVVSATGNYSVRVTDSSGCAGVSVPVYIEFKNIVVTDIIVNGPSVICDGDTTWLEAPEGFVEYVWSDSTTGRVRPVTEPGEYYVYVTDMYGCSGVSNSVTIDLIALPEHSIKGPTISCVNVEAEYYVDDVPGLQLQWQCTGGVILGDPTARVITVQWTKEGKGILTLDITKNGVTCSALYKYEVAVVLHFDFDIVVSGPTKFCTDEGVVLYAPKGFKHYNWSNGGTADSIIVRTSGAFWVTITDLEGCEGVSDTVYTTSIPSPAAIIEPMGPTDLCEGDSVVLQSQFVHDRYKWSNGETTRRITVTSPGLYALTVTNTEGCSATSDTLTVHIAENPTPEITGPDQVCQEEVARYQTALHPGSAYKWSVSGGQILSGAGTGAVEIVWHSNGTFALNVRETSSGGCIGDANVFQVEVLAAPQPVIVQTGDVLSTDAWTSYQWNRDGEPMQGADQRTFDMTIPGTYTVTVTNEDGCQGTSDSVVFAPYATSTVSVPDLTALPGERVFVPVFVAASSGFLDDAVESFDGALLIPAGILYPFGATPIGSVANGIRRIPLSGLKTSGSDTLAVFEFVAMLGNSKRSEIRLESFAWDNSGVAVETTQGSIELVVCREGGDRLFSDTGILQLAQNAPNPYNSSTIITFHLIERGHTRLAVLDMLGREVAVIIDRSMEPGDYSAYFDASNLSSGTYMYVLSTPTGRLQRTMRLMK